MKQPRKRLNLSFDVRREADRQVYEILSQTPHKTAYMIQTVLAYEANQTSGLDRNVLKQVFREVLTEMNISIGHHPKAEKQDLPDAVFSIFEQL